MEWSHVQSSIQHSSSVINAISSASCLDQTESSVVSSKFKYGLTTPTCSLACHTGSDVEIVNLGTSSAGRAN